MSKARVVINPAGAVRLLGSDEVAADLARRARAIAAKANVGLSPDGMGNDPYTAKDGKAGRGRARASVVASSPHGIHDNARNNTLLKSLDAGR